MLPHKRTQTQKYSDKSSPATTPRKDWLGLSVGRGDRERSPRPPAEPDVEQQQRTLLRALSLSLSLCCSQRSSAVFWLRVNCSHLGDYATRPSSGHLEPRTVELRLTSRRRVNEVRRQRAGLKTISVGILLPFRYLCVCLFKWPSLCETKTTTTSYELGTSTLKTAFVLCGIFF